MTLSTARIVEPLQIAKIYLFRTDCLAVEEFAYKDILSSIEIARANRLVFTNDKNHFIKSTSLMRLLLSSYLGITPDKLNIRTNELGKPYTDTSNHRINFNFSRSPVMQVLGISENNPIGVDIEPIRPIDDWQHIAKRCLSTEEIQQFSHLTEQQRDELFWNYWTAKEAILKATGIGLRCEPSTLCLQQTNNQHTFKPYMPVFSGMVNHQPWFAYTYSHAGHVISVATNSQHTLLQSITVDSRQAILPYRDEMPHPAKALA